MREQAVLYDVDTNIT